MTFSGLFLCSESCLGIKCVAMRSSKVYSIIETLLQEIVYPTSDPNFKN